MSGQHRLAVAFAGAHPARAAMALERMQATRAAAVLGALPAREAGMVLRDMSPPQAADALALAEPGTAGEILAGMRSDDAAIVLRAVGRSARNSLLSALPEETAEVLARSLYYPDGSAGAVMDPSIFQLPEDALVADARARLTRAARALLYYLYVVDREHRLVGVLDIPELMLARARDPLSAAMHRNVDHLTAWLPVALVREHPAWQRYHALPVVDEAGHLVGAIRYQTLRRLERDASGGAPDPTFLTVRALGEIFQLGTTGLVAGVAAAASSPSAPGDPAADPIPPPPARGGSDAS